MIIASRDNKSITYPFYLNSLSHHQCFVNRLQWHCCRM